MDVNTLLSDLDHLPDTFRREFEDQVLGYIRDLYHHAKQIDSNLAEHINDLRSRLENTLEKYVDRLHSTKFHMENGAYRKCNLLDWKLLDESEYGNIYMVRDETGKSLVAKQLMDDADLTEIKNYAFLMNTACHKYIIPYSGHIRSNCDGKETYTYILMDYTPGITLYRYRQEGRTNWTPEDIFSQLEEALSCLHRHKFYHRDLSARNIYLTDDHRVLLLDFGLSCHGQNHCVLHTGTLFYYPDHWEDWSLMDLDLYAMGMNIVLFFLKDEQIGHRITKYTINQLQEPWKTKVQTLTKL